MLTLSFLIIDLKKACFLRQKYFKNILFFFLNFAFSLFN